MSYIAVNKINKIIFLFTILVLCLIIISCSESHLRYMGFDREIDSGNGILYGQITMQSIYPEVIRWGTSDQKWNVAYIYVKPANGAADGDETIFYQQVEDAGLFAIELPAGDYFITKVEVILDAEYSRKKDIIYFIPAIEVQVDENFANYSGNIRCTSSRYYVDLDMYRTLTFLENHASNSGVSSPAITNMTQRLALDETGGDIEIDEEYRFF